MSITFRHYIDPADYKRIDDFLIRHYQPGNRDGKWIEPSWEYMHFHPALDSASLDKIGIWEDAGEIVAVVNYEWHLGDAFFQFRPAYRHLRQEMLDYAEANLFGLSKRDRRKYLCAYVNDNDEEFVSLVKGRGYEIDVEGCRPMYQLAIPEPFPAITLPAGFRLLSLADECDWTKVNRVLWRGFNHEGEPPVTPEELESRRKMFDTPSGRRDLKIVVEAPDGEFVAFCGMFYEPYHKFAYVEPVATDPAYRRLGLGKAAVLEGIRRCGALGATVAYVGSNQKFYQAIGFTKVYNSDCWLKYLDGEKT
jgi:GNAT superfamily N-acetyltransferase